MPTARGYILSVSLFIFVVFVVPTTQAQVLDVSSVTSPLGLCRSMTANALECGAQGSPLDIPLVIGGSGFVGEITVTVSNWPCVNVTVSTPASLSCVFSVPSWGDVVLPIVAVNSTGAASSAQDVFVLRPSEPGTRSWVCCPVCPICVSHVLYSVYLLTRRLATTLSL
jgi:hypothetical protein